MHGASAHQPQTSSPITPDPVENRVVYVLMIHATHLILAG
jgi:hypothetical protein